MRYLPSSVVVLSVLSGGTARALAQPVRSSELLPRAGAATPTNGPSALLEGWLAFTDIWRLLDMVMVLLLALVLAAVIAYHPTTRRAVSTLEHLEHPKTILMYGVVAAVVALIVQVEPAMAFVIFGIGGLLRFRTLVGEAKETGRVILVTVVGLCCGLKIFIVAIPATVIGWLLIFVLEQQPMGTIRVSGVPENMMHEASRTYRNLIMEAGCIIIGEQTRFTRREFAFVVKAPQALDRNRLQSLFDELPAEWRGVVDWERL